MSKYVYTDLWKNSKQGDREDIRGSEVMMQRDRYTPGGTRWSKVFQAAKDRMAAAQAAYAANPTEDNKTDLTAYTINRSDTFLLMPRLWKFTDDKHPSGNIKNYDCEVYMIRMAETYLLRAEAYLALGKTAEAAADINVLRDRANAPRVSASDIDIDFILDERTRELLGEEHRQITLNRLSVNPNCGSYVTSKYPTQDETTSNTLYERVRKYGVSYTNCTDANNTAWGRVWDSNEERWIPNIKPYNYQWPISADVISSNSGAEYPQNTGY